MPLIYAILGAILGAIIFSSAGGVLGAAIGFLIGALIEVKQRLSKLEQDVISLKSLKHQGVLDTDDAKGAQPTHEKPQEYVPVSEMGTKPSPVSSLSAKAEQTPDQPKPAKRLSKESQPSKEGSAVINVLKNYLTGGNVIARVGVIILFFGVAFLLKYAADHDMLPIEARLVGVALGGIIMLAVGWQLRYRRTNYALVLQGGGTGVLYLTVFAALRLYSLVPTVFAFAVLVAIALLSAILAVLQNSRSFAVLGAVGGFLAPILASTGEGSHVTLFSYYVVLNSGIFFIAWFKAWRLLNVVGFMFTFVIGTSWGYKYYRPEYFTTTEPFLILFFLLYVGISVLFAMRQPLQLKGYVDGTLVFGTPIAAFALQASLVESYKYGLAWSSLALGLFYLFLARLLFLKAKQILRILIETFLASGVVFGTLAIPFALDARWTSALWALEGAAIVWIGVRQKRLLPRIFGVVLQLGAGIAFLITAGLAPLSGMGRSTNELPLLNADYIGMLILSFAGLFTAFYLYKHRESITIHEPKVSLMLFIFGMLWWFGGALHEVLDHVSRNYKLGCVLVFITASCAACHHLERRLNWPNLGVLARGLLLAMLFITALMSAIVSHPLAYIGIIAWPLAFASHYFILRRYDDRQTGYIKFMHAGALWLMTLLAAWELSWLVDRLVKGSGIWGLIAWALIPALVLLLLSTVAHRLNWPVKKHKQTYLTLGGAPIAVYVWLWSLVVNSTSPGNPWPLSYLPILNPLDITLGFLFLTLLIWIRIFQRSAADFWNNQSNVVYSFYTGSLFLWLNAILFRTVHHWSRVPFSLPAMLDSVIVQASLSILWSLTGLFAMVFGTRTAQRKIWIVGTGLMAVVVFKLFLIDLSNSETVERIISFMGVGILLLVVGYLSPVPPRTKSEARTK